MCSAFEKTLPLPPLLEIDSIHLPINYCRGLGDRLQLNACRAQHGNKNECDMGRV